MAFAIALLSLYWLLRSDYAIAGGLLAIVTYGSFLFLAMIPTKLIASEKLMDRVIGLVGKVLVFEAVVGILQAVVNARESGGFDLANGDAVHGTLFFSFQPDLAFSNPMFAANVVFFLLALVPNLISKRRSFRWPVTLGAVAFVLASVVHMILFAAVATTFAILVFRPPFSKNNRLVRISLAALLPLLALTFLSENLQTVTHQIDLFLTGNLPKAEMVSRSLSEMPRDYPEMSIVGLGPGQFSSRAALIGTGMYIGGLDDPKSIPFLHPTTTAALDNFLYDLWLDASNLEAYGGSSSAKPFFSWMSVYTEFGAPVLLGVFVYSFILLRRMKSRAHSPRQKWLATVSGAGIVFLLLLGFQENYWEMPQAILLGLMLIQVMYANIVYGNRVCSPGSLL
jgi:hypothetical protein